MAIVLTPETEMKLRDRAGRDGRDPDGLAESVLAAFLNGEMVRVGPNIPFVADDDYEALDILIAEADEDFSAGRFKSVDQLIADKRERFGIVL